VLCLSAGAIAQRDGYPLIEAAMAQTNAQAIIVMDAGGWQTQNNRTDRYQLRYFMKDAKIRVEQFVNDERRLIIVADGALVWRYDTLKNEYTYLKQPEERLKTVELVASWSRTQLQRPIRVLAGSIRWMVVPVFEYGNGWTRVHQTRPAGQDWRGTDVVFRYDDQNRIERMTAEDKLDLTAGFQHTWIEALFTYPQTLDIDFSFKPPAGSKPAADLPVRAPETQPGQGGRGGGG
jgi:hypothetical protein